MEKLGHHGCHNVYEDVKKIVGCKDRYSSEPQEVHKVRGVQTQYQGYVRRAWRHNPSFSHVRSSQARKTLAIGPLLILAAHTHVRQYA